MLGVAAQAVAWRLRIPGILILLLLGFLGGPGADLLRGESGGPLLDPDALFGDLLFPLVGASVALVLYEGGLTLRLAEIRGVSRVVWMLVTVGAAATAVVGALAARLLLDLPWELAWLLGALLIVTGPTVVGPLLRHIRPAGRVGPVLRWEGIVIDPIGALAAVLVLEVLLAGDSSSATGEVAWAILKTLLAGGGLGFLAAVLLVIMLSRYWIPEHLQNPVSLMLVVACFTAANAVQAESGLLAATVMGVVLANQKRTTIEHILEFKENLGVLIISSLFIVLAARIRVEDLTGVDWLAVAGFIAVLIFIARPLSVAVSTVRSGLSLRQRLMIAWLAPRGIVAAAVASVFALALEQAAEAGTVSIDAPERLVPLTFAVIVGTVTVYGLTAGPVAALLGVADQDPRGLVIIGASPLPRSLAAAMKRVGTRTLLVDTNRGNVFAARMQGLEAVYGNVLEEFVFEGLDLHGLGRAAAMTPNEEVNTLVSQKFERLFGRARVYRLAARKPKAKPAETGGKRAAGEAPQPQTAEHGRPLFGKGVDLAGIERRLTQGSIIKVTTLSESFGWQQYRTLYGPQSVPLATIDEQGRAELVVAGKELAPGPGATIVSLVDPDSLLMPQLAPVENAPA